MGKYIKLNSDKSSKHWCSELCVKDTAQRIKTAIEKQPCGQGHCTYFHGCQTDMFGTTQCGWWNFFWSEYGCGVQK
jgi:hypothetical protein